MFSRTLTVDKTRHIGISGIARLVAEIEAVTRKAKVRVSLDDAAMFASNPE